MPWWVLAVLVLGANFALWGSAGLARLIESHASRPRLGQPSPCSLRASESRGVPGAVPPGSRASGA